MSELSSKYVIPLSHHFFLQQCICFVQSLCMDKSLCFVPTLIDLLVQQGRHRMSHIYNPIRQEWHTSAALQVASTWNRTLRSSEAQHRILRGYNTMCLFVQNEFWREKQLKILHGAYLPCLKWAPDHTHRICSLCGKYLPTLLHKLWLCPRISRFWDKILQFIMATLGLLLPKDIYALMFGYLDTTLAHISKSDRKSLVHHKLWILNCLMIARRAILKQWTAPHYKRGATRHTYPSAEVPHRLESQPWFSPTALPKEVAYLPGSASPSSPFVSHKVLMPVPISDFAACRLTFLCIISVCSYSFF